MDGKMASVAQVPLGQVVPVVYTSYAHFRVSNVQELV